MSEKRKNEAECIRGLKNELVSQDKGPVYMEVGDPR